jgi:hypothetical protein
VPIDQVDMLDRLVPPHLVLLFMSGVYLVLTLFPWQQSCVRGTGLPSGQECLHYRGWDTLPGAFSALAVLAVLCLVRLALWRFPERRIAWVVIRDLTFVAAFLMASGLILEAVRYGNGDALGTLGFAVAGYAEVAIMAVMLVSALGVALEGWRGLIDRMPRLDRL